MTTASKFILRDLTAEDQDGLKAFHERCSAETHYLRFFNAKPHLSDAEAAHFCSVDQRQRGAIVAVDQEAPDVIWGVGRWDKRGDSDEAEIAFVVDDVHQHRGIGRTLVDAVKQRAVELGLRYLFGETLPQNSRMRRLLNQTGRCDWHYEYGAARFRLGLAADGVSAE
jgi:RimJ/RimL family protein N-acetyltransferase